MIDPNAVRRLGSWLARSERILLLAHQEPDGDTIASVLAFANALANTNKKITLVCKDPIPSAFQFLPGSALFKHDFLAGDYDLILAFDCGDAHRTGFVDRLKWFAGTKRKLVNVDHHPRNDLHRLANLNIIDFEAASATQVVYQILQSLELPITSTIASCILCGLYTDTGGFKYANTNTDVLQLAAELMEYGGRLQDAIRNLFSRRRVSMLRLWGIALDRLQYHSELGIIASLITLDDMEECGADEQDAVGVINLIKNVPDTRIAMLFTEQSDGSIRVSLRSDVADVDVAELAALFGGGGLRKSGGFTFSGHFTYDGEDWDVEFV